MKSLLIIITIAELILLSLYPAVGYSIEKTITPISVIGCSKIQFPDSDKRPSFILDISNDQKIEDAWPEDYFILRIYDPLNNETLAETHFHSSYGYFNLEVFDITGDGIEEFILIQGDGRGTSARQENIIVLQRSGHNLNQILKEPISNYYGTEYKWWYEHKLLLMDSNKTALRLILKSNTVDKDCSLCSPSLIPGAKIKEFIYDKNKGVMALYHISE